MRISPADGNWEDGCKLCMRSHVDQLRRQLSLGEVCAAKGAVQVNPLAGQPSFSALSGLQTCSTLQRRKWTQRKTVRCPCTAYCVSPAHTGIHATQPQCSVQAVTPLFLSVFTQVTLIVENQSLEHESSSSSSLFLICQNIVFQNFVPLSYSPFHTALGKIVPI